MFIIHSCCQDFFDWRPSSTFDNTGARRMKKANQAKEQNKGLEWERKRERVSERERSLESKGATGGSGGKRERPSPKEGRGNKPHSPSTFPRTKGPGLPPSQKVALENLRQQLSYSDAEEVGVFGSLRTGLILLYA